MKYFDLALALIVANPGEALALLLALLSAASTLCEFAGWTKASKWLGTISLDGGRLVRLAKRGIAIRKALAGLLFVGLLTSCSSAPPQMPPMVCPLPSQYLAALPTPAAVASSVQAAQGVVEQAKVVAEDPAGGAAVLVAAKALDTIEPLCPSLTEAAKVDCATKVADARALLAKSDATRQQVCAAVKLAVIVAQVAEDSVPLVALDEVCR